MNTENYGPNMNITIHNDKTKKLVTIEIDHSKDILQNILKGTTLLRSFEDILETKLMPIHVNEKGFFVNLSEDKLLTLISALVDSLFPFIDNPKDEDGQVVEEEGHIWGIVHDLKTLF